MTYENPIQDKIEAFSLDAKKIEREIQILIEFCNLDEQTAIAIAKVGYNHFCFWQMVLERLQQRFPDAMRALKRDDQT
jgi:hypothetical protein